MPTACISTRAVPAPARRRSRSSSSWKGPGRGEKVLYITLSETRRELGLVARRHGWSLDGIEIFELVPPETTLDPERELTVLHPAEMELSETTKLVFDRVAQLNPTRVVFDSLSELRLLAQSSLRYRRQILALKHFFSGRGCTVVLLDDLSSQANDLQLHSISHGVVLLGATTRALGRYELDVDGHVAVAYYKEADGVVTFTHTEVPKALEDRGIGSRLAKGALERMRANGHRVIAQYPFIAGYIKKHPEFADLLANPS